jgi:hypothetical protein
MSAKDVRDTRRSLRLHVVGSDPGRTPVTDSARAFGVVSKPMRLRRHVPTRRGPSTALYIGCERPTRVQVDAGYRSPCRSSRVHSTDEGVNRMPCPPRVRSLQVRSTRTIRLVEPVPTAARLSIVTSLSGLTVPPSSRRTTPSRSSAGTAAGLARTVSATTRVSPAECWPLSARHEDNSSTPHKTATNVPLR